MNLSLPCFGERTELELNQSIKYYDFFTYASYGSCKPCLAIASISVPLNLLCIYVIYRSQATAVANGKLAGGPIHLIFVGKVLGNCQ